MLLLVPRLSDWHTPRLGFSCGTPGGVAQSAIPTVRPFRRSIIFQVYTVVWSLEHLSPVLSDVQGPAQSPEAQAAEPSKPEPSRASVKALVGSRARLRVTEARAEPLSPGLVAVLRVYFCS